MSAHAPALMSWSSVPYPVVIADLAGTVRHTNPRAEDLFPGIVVGAPLGSTVPAWLAEAHTRRTADDRGEGDAVSGPVAERMFEAHPSVQDDGSVAWWLTDDTDHRLAREALETERDRTAFLTEASNTLLSSLNLQRCMDVTAQLAAGHLADAALVVAPRSGNRLPVVTCTGYGQPERSLREVNAEDVPGLAEALQGFPPVPSRWIDPASAPDWLVPEVFGPVGSIVVTPLPGHGVPAGALILLRRSEEAAFTEQEEVFARLFAARAGCRHVRGPAVRGAGLALPDPDARPAPAGPAPDLRGRLRRRLPSVEGPRADRRRLLRRPPRHHRR